VQLALERLDGVDNAEVSLRAEQAVVAYDPGKVTVQQMIEAVERSGFGAEKVP
jgi:copper chaperone CopZ